MWPSGLPSPARWSSVRFRRRRAGDGAVRPGRHDQHPGANDLAECLEHGLIVGAPGITIDLGGHTFDGIGLGAGVWNPGFDDVTIANGTLTGFDFGVLVTAGAGTTS